MTLIVWGDRNHLHSDDSGDRVFNRLLWWRWQSAERLRCSFRWPWRFTVIGIIWNWRTGWRTHFDDTEGSGWLGLSAVHWPWQQSGVLLSMTLKVQRLKAITLIIEHPADGFDSRRCLFRWPWWFTVTRIICSLITRTKRGRSTDSFDSVDYQPNGQGAHFKDINGFGWLILSAV